MSRIKNLASSSGLLMAALAISACTSNGQFGDGAISGTSGGIAGSSGSSGMGASSGPANDGSGPTSITNGGKPVSGNFVCTAGARLYGSPTTEVGSNGLLGGPLTTLLNGLGGTTATQLLNSVTEPDNVIDGNLSTYATFDLTAGLITGLLDSVDLSVVMPSGVTVPPNKFAVYGLSFPKGTVDLSLVNSVEVATYLKDTLQESNTVNQSALTLLGAIGGSTPSVIWLGVETNKPYDRATVSLTPGLLSASVGDAMHVYELCVDGELKSAPSSSSSSSSSSSGSSSSSSSSSGGKSSSSSSSSSSSGSSSGTSSGTSSGSSGSSSGG